MKESATSRYHPLQVTLHWLTVILIFAAFLLGKSMSQLPNEDASKLAPMAIHMSLGIITLTVIIVRFVMRSKYPQPAYASTGNALFDALGRFVHFALYALVALMAFSGITLSMQAGLAPIVFFGSGASLPANLFAFTSRAVHGFIAPALLLLVLVHVGAAFYHQWFIKDGLFSRLRFGK